MTDKNEAPARAAHGAGGEHGADNTTPIVRQVVSESNPQTLHNGKEPPDALAFGALIRAVIVRGEEPPDGAHYGAYHQEADELCNAYRGRGRDGFLRVWGALTRHRPELAAFELDPNADPWQWFTLADAYQDRPPLVYIVQDLICLPSLVVVYSAPGTLKSLLLQEMSVCVAGGLLWLPPQPGDTSGLLARKTRQAPVLWVDVDNGRRRCHERFGALARTHDLAADTPLHYVSFPAPPMDASAENFVDSMVLRVEQFGAKLMVIDNLKRISGDIDENSGEMDTVMANLRTLVEETGIACVVIHHQRKTAGVTGREGDNLRGHSSIEAAIDLALAVKRDANADTIELHSTKTRDVDVLPFGALWTYTHKPGTRELDTARFFGLAVEDTTSDRAVMDAVLRAVDETPGIEQRTLKSVVKEWLPDVGINRIATIANRLVTENKLRAHEGENRKKVYEPK